MPAEEATAASVLREFLQATGQQDIILNWLVNTVWSEGLPNAAAPFMVAAILEFLDNSQGSRTAQDSGSVLFLLGLLSHTGTEDLRKLIRAGVPRYVELLRRARGSQPLTAVLCYLLSQFPDDREQIWPEACRLPLPTEDASRLERCLQHLNLAGPAIGRAWPAPSGWVLSPAEAAADRQWVQSLDAESIAAFWDKDTRSLLTYSGARAYGAITTGLVDDPALAGDAARAGADARDEPQMTAVGPLGSNPAQLMAVLRCPRCGGNLHCVDGPATVACYSCTAQYDAGDDFLDLSGEALTGSDQIAGNSPLYLPRYENLLRPAFIRIHGTNWRQLITPAAEDDYLAKHVRPADGPVLDLAAGAGRWTAVLARALGHDRIIGVDLAATMVSRLRTVLPGVVSLRGAAGNLPFHDASLGAINCWNALQSMADPVRVIHQVGRCLRDHGTFTLLTFARSTDPVYRFFQREHEQCLTVCSFPVEEIHQMLQEARLEITDDVLSGTTLTLTATKIPAASSCTRS